MTKAAVKSLIGSALGIFIFFIPLPDSAGKWKIPLVHIIGWVKSSLGTPLLNALILIVLAALSLTWISSLNSKNPKLQAFHRKDGKIVGSLFIVALLIAFLLVFAIGPDWLLNKDIGGLVLDVSRTVFVTIIVAGIGVLLLTEFGILEFLGALLEPFMRPLYRTPGVSAVDAITSFVAAPAVGIFMTNKLYLQKVYTQREAAFIATSFSICSLGFFAFLAATANILPYLPHMIISSFLINFSIAIIMVRIPPLSRKADHYVDGSLRNPAQEEKTHFSLAHATNAACARAAQFTLAALQKGIIDAISFSVKILAYVVSIATIALIIATYTPFFDWVGIIFKPYLHLMNLPDVDKIAPTVLISLSEIALPAILIHGSAAAPAAAFFVCTLTTIQIIFFTESANAMLESDIPLNIWELILIFLIRTIIGIPLVALATHLIF